MSHSPIVRSSRSRLSRVACLAAVGGLLAAPITPLVGCESLPGGDKEQGAVIGGAAGAAGGAVIAGEGNRALGAIIGGVLGAGGGYLIGANKDKILGDEDKAKEEAKEANRNAQKNPATAKTDAEIRSSDTADINGDGFITLDEVVALHKAGLSDQEMLIKLQKTGQVFQLNDEQNQHLRDAGVSEAVIERMADLNTDEFDRVHSKDGTEVIGGTR